MTGVGVPWPRSLERQVPWCLSTRLRVPTVRKPQAACRGEVGRVLGKISDWTVHISALSVAVIGTLSRGGRCLAAAVGVNVDGALDDAGIDVAAGGRAARGPAELGRVGVESDEAVLGQAGGGEPFPGGWLPS